MTYNEGQLDVIHQFTFNLNEITIKKFKDCHENGFDLANFHYIWLHDDPYNYHLVPRKDKNHG